MYETGCRKGEAFALSWDDIDSKNKTVKISKNLTRKTTEGPWKIVSSKNKTSNRTVSLSNRLCEILKKHKEQCSSYQFVFGGAAPLAEKTVTRYFDAAIDKAGVKRIRIHDLRHSCASFLISKGVSIVGVSKRLGHKDVKQTLNTYSHLMPNEAQKIVDIFEDLD